MKTNEHIRSVHTLEAELIREFFLGFVKIHILYHASKERVYGSGLIEELSRHGYRIGPGTLYPTLHKLSTQGFLKIETEIVDGRLRKYYSITATGRKLLMAARRQIVELTAEVME